jgi:hypothetical protein
MAGRERIGIAGDANTLVEERVVIVLHRSMVLLTAFPTMFTVGLKPTQTKTLAGGKPLQSKPYTARG